MAVSPYILKLREKLGHDLLLLPGVCALVFNAAGEILLQRRSDNGRWAVLGGMTDPGEEPAQTVVREVMEETGMIVKPERITGVYMTPAIQYVNGDRAQYIITTFLCRPIEGEPRVNDDESLEVRYFPLDSLPTLRPDHRQRLDDALANRPEAFFVGDRA